MDASAQAPEIRKAVGEIIRRRRRDRDLTQRQLGEMVGVSGAQILTFEKGIRPIEVTRLVAIARVLDIKLGELDQPLRERAA
ncbi:MAG TPA: helix-turn-helix transcriptional regulator [Aliidongia sp.]|uniref:helix-turn-helix domain-containing protein n=1 Tax=Aliidongia sp. TaxID=1914230 RepID=UPI002DDD2385|nr:helix-turn-helix transcriptional regulator [Aliidongia sp.]HEV2673277.1 helix-turn-helix transcriptional regulator [Aliidongia sp.]